MIWSQALGLDSATCAGLVHGQWLLLLYSLRINVPEKDWQLFFLELSEILKRQWPTLRVFNACPSDWSATSFKVKFLFEKYAHACLDIASWTFDNNSYSFALNKKCNLDLFTLALSVGALFTQAKVLEQYFSTGAGYYDTLGCHLIMSGVPPAITFNGL